MILNSSQVGKSVWMCDSHPAAMENTLFAHFGLKTALTAGSKAKYMEEEIHFQFYQKK